MIILLQACRNLLGATLVLPTCLRLLDNVSACCSQWKCDLRHRTRAVPHIKTYCRVSPDLSQLAWFHLTSANMSKAAWGCQTKAGANNILSYEAGVLFLPKFVVSQVRCSLLLSSFQISCQITTYHPQENNQFSLKST